jgi:hypothetical protein
MLGSKDVIEEHDGWTDGRMDGRMDGRTDGWTCWIVIGRICVKTEWGWLLCERGAGSGERGGGISYFNI